MVALVVAILYAVDIAIKIRHARDAKADIQEVKEKLETIHQHLKRA